MSWRVAYEHIRICCSTIDLAIRTRDRIGSAKLGDHDDAAGRGHLLGWKTTAAQSSSSLEGWLGINLFRFWLLHAPGLTLRDLLG